MDFSLEEIETPLSVFAERRTVLGGRHGDLRDEENDKRTRSYEANKPPFVHQMCVGERDVVARL